MHTVRVEPRMRHTVRFMKGKLTGANIVMDRTVDPNRPWLLRVTEQPPFGSPAHRRVQEDWILTAVDNFRVDDEESAERVLEHFWQYETPSKLMEFQVKSGFKTFTCHFKGGSEWEPMYFVMPDEEQVRNFLRAIELVREKVAEAEKPKADKVLDLNIVKVATVQYEQHNDLFPKEDEVVLKSGNLRRVLPDNPIECR